MHAVQLNDFGSYQMRRDLFELATGDPMYRVKRLSEKDETKKALPLINRLILDEAIKAEKISDSTI